MRPVISCLALAILICIASPLSAQHNDKPEFEYDPPQSAYAGEVFEMNITLDGKPDAATYTHTVLIGETVLAERNGVDVSVMVPADAIGQQLIVKPKYDGESYGPMRVERETSDDMYGLSFPITAAMPHLVENSFVTGGEYSVNDEFEFVALRCGRCEAGNIQNIDREDIRIVVETEDGRDLFDHAMVVDRKNPTTGADAGTMVKFYLRGKTDENGTEAVIRVTYGAVHKEFYVVLFPN
ncbi:MAG: hypothetical protein CL946_07600 [Ectothiorhodospiraceae bacterium]|nr:hypothetical protein [Ectothiorhodospiraceae bacterium]